MANDNKSNDGGKNDKKNGEVKVPARGWILLMAVIAFIPLLMMVRNQAETKYHPSRPNQFSQKGEPTPIFSPDPPPPPHPPPVQENTRKFLGGGRTKQPPFQIKLK